MAKKTSKVDTRLTVTAFARLAGRSRPAIYKAIKEGRVIQLKNSKINPSNRLNTQYVDSCKPNDTKNQKTKPQNPKAYKPEKLDLGVKSGNSRAVAELQKVQADVALKENKIKRDRQMLIDRRLIQNLIGLLSTIDTNELLTIPENVAPELAGICGKEDNATILKVSQKLETHLYGVLKHRKRELIRFLEKVESEVGDNETDK